MLIQLLIVAVLALHLICVNVAAAGPLVCIWFDWRGVRGDALSERVGRSLCRHSLVLLFVGGGLGLVLAWLHWDEQYHAVLHQFPSKIFFGAWELVFSVVLVTLVLVWWRVAPRSKPAAWGRGFLLILAGTNLLYHFPFLFAIIARVDAGALQPVGEVDASVFRGLMMQAGVMPQAVHFGVASFAMVGMLLIGWALVNDRTPAETDGGALPESDSAAANDQATSAQPTPAQAMSDLGPDALRIGQWGARLALIATLCQLPVGMWLVVKLAPDSQQRVMGADLVATGLLGLSIFLSLGLLHHLSSLALGVPRRKSMVVALAMMAALVLMMTGVLQRM